MYSLHALNVIVIIIMSPAHKGNRLLERK